MHRQLISLIGLSLLVSGIWVSASAAEKNNPGSRPNILFFVADDLSYHSLGYAGDPVVKSPNIDALAAQSVVFTHASVTTSICMISRASFLTGQYLTRMGGARVDSENWANTWPAQLRKAGYYGGHIGKVHVVGQDANNYDFWAGRNKLGYQWNKQANGALVHSLDLDTNAALKFLAERPKEKPFFLQVAYTVPHAEDSDPKQYLPMPQEESLYQNVMVPVPTTATNAAWMSLPAFFRDQKNESRHRWDKRFSTPSDYQLFVKNYYRLISGMDRSIGTILEALKKNGASDITIVIFTSDNGYFLGEHGLADKWYAYEESVRVPLIIYDPRLPADQRAKKRDDLTLNVDLAPTFCAFAGITPPQVMQGTPLIPLLAEPSPASWRKDFLYQFKWSSEIIPASEGVCSKDIKYIRWIVSGVEELFDLRTDPHEEHNLAVNPEHKALLAQMRVRIAELKKEVGGPTIEALSYMPNGTNKSKEKGKGKGIDSEQESEK